MAIFESIKIYCYSKNKEGQTEEESQQTKTRFLPIVGILGITILTAILAGGGVYLWMQNKEDQTSTQNQTTSDQSTKTERERADSPTDVAENFILSTLGTVPGAIINYEEANTYMSEELKTQFTEDAFIPQFYGIQQGPDDYEMETETINGATAFVKVAAKYGTMTEAWAFILVKEVGEWKIDEFRNDAQ